MKVSLKVVTHVAHKIAIDLSKSGIVTLTQGIDPVAKEAEKILEANVKQEMALDEKVNSIVDDNEEQIEFYLADERQLFFMIKRKLAPEFGFIIDYEERFSDLSHKILDVLYEEDLIHFDVAENRVKNIIYNSVTSFISENHEIESAVREKLFSYKRKLIPGTDDYEIMYDKLLKEELLKRGMA
jgi:uncharacterized protein